MKPRNRAFEPAQFLKAQGFKKKDDGYINPSTGRKLSKQSALNKAASVLGWKSFDLYRRAYTSVAYTRLKGYAEALGRPTGLGTKFNSLFRDAYQTNPPLKKGSKELTALLTYVGKRNKNTTHRAGETPRKNKRFAQRNTNATKKKISNKR